MTSFVTRSTILMSGRPVFESNAKCNSLVGPTPPPSLVARIALRISRFFAACSGLFPCGPSRAPDSCRAPEPRIYAVVISSLLLRFQTCGGLLQGVTLVTAAAVQRRVPYRTEYGGREKLSGALSIAPFLDCRSHCTDVAAHQHCRQVEAYDRFAKHPIWRSRLTSLPLAPIPFVESAEFGGERGSLDPQQVGGACLVAPGALQSLLEQPQFELHHNRVEIQPPGGQS